MKKIFSKIMLLAIFLTCAFLLSSSIFATNKNLKIIGLKRFTFASFSHNNTLKTQKSILSAKNFEEKNKNILTLKQNGKSQNYTGFNLNNLNQTNLKNLNIEAILHSFDENLYSNYTILSENEFYYINKETNKIEYFNNGNIKSFGEYGNLDGQFTQIKFFNVLKNREFCVLDSLNRLQFFDSNFNHIKTLQHIETNNNFILLGKICSVTTDIYSNVYLLDYTNNLVLKANSSLNNFQVVLNTENLNENSKLNLLNTTNEIVILNNNNIILQNQESSIATKIEEYSTSLSTPLEIDLNNLEIFTLFSDAQNYIFLVTENIIFKLSKELNIETHKFMPFGREYNISLEDGKIYYISSSEINLIENFATDISSYSPPVNALEETILTNQVEIYSLNTDANLLNNPFSNLNSTLLLQNSLVIKLGETTNLQNNFCYVLYLNQNSYSLGYIEKKYLTLNAFDAQNYFVYPARSDVKYYKYPTNNIDILQNAKLDINQNYKVNRKITINNLEFAEINLNNSFIYVLNNETIDSNTNYINTYLTTNARIKLYSNYTQVNVYNNLNKEEVLLTLSKNTNVKILETSKELTKVSFIYENEIITGYVENKFVVKENNFIMPITIILSLVSIIVLVVIIILIKKRTNRQTKNKL